MYATFIDYEEAQYNRHLLQNSPSPRVDDPRYAVVEPLSAMPEFSPDKERLWSKTKFCEESLGVLRTGRG